MKNLNKKNSLRKDDFMQYIFFEDNSYVVKSYKEENTLNNLTALLDYLATEELRKVFEKDEETPVIRPKKKKVVRSRTRGDQILSQMYDKDKAEVAYFKRYNKRVDKSFEALNMIEEITRLNCLEEAFSMEETEEVIRNGLFVTRELTIDYREGKMNFKTFLEGLREGFKNEFFKC